MEVRSARAKLLQIELRRFSQEQEAGSSDAASLIKKLQESLKTFPESVELRGMLLRAEDSLERAERARYEAAARASAIELEVKTYTRLLETGQAAKALSALEEAAAKYPESEQLQSLLTKCKEQIAAEHEVQRQAAAQRAAIQAAIDKGRSLLGKHRYEEAGALLEVACQQWPQEKELEKLLSAARKSAERQAAEQEKSRQRKLQLAQRPAKKPRRLLLIGGVVAAVLVYARGSDQVLNAAAGICTYGCDDSLWR